MNNCLKSILVLSIIAVVSLIGMTSCGGGSKKAATEALEFIEKKAGSKAAANTVEREASQAERTVVRETESYTPSRLGHTHRPRHSFYDDEEDYESQVYTVQCSQCGGAGAVYVIDYYGNIQYDYYGNPLVSQCPYCNGTGAIIVYQ